jgi:hypothetical protein
LLEGSHDELAEGGLWDLEEKRFESRESRNPTLSTIHLGPPFCQLTKGFLKQYASGLVLSSRCKGECSAQISEMSINDRDVAGKSYSLCQSLVAAGSSLSLE